MESLYFVTTLIFVILVLYRLVIVKKMIFSTKEIDNVTGLPLKLSVKELGLLEGRIDHLKEVIIVADQIEKPIQELEDAVLKNFNDGIKYKFYISNKNFEKERSNYFLIFEALAKISGETTSVDGLVEIDSLGFDWENYPFIFYKFGDLESIFCYRGVEMKEGIAENYVLLDPKLSYTIYKAIKASLMNNNNLDIKSLGSIKQFQFPPHNAILN